MYFDKLNQSPVLKLACDIASSSMHIPGAALQKPTLLVAKVAGNMCAYVLKSLISNFVQLYNFFTQYSREKNVYKSVLKLAFDIASNNTHITLGQVVCALSRCNAAKTDSPSF